MNWTALNPKHSVLPGTRIAGGSLTRSGLSLTAGQPYYILVQSRNAGGLWSASGVSNGVVAGAVAPTALFSASPVSGTAPLQVTFTDQSSGSITGRLWDFGDGITSTLPSPTHTYTIAGVYTVTLTVSGPGGTNSLQRANLIVVYLAPQADFTAWPRSGVVPLTVSFTNSSTGAYTGNLWSFGDGVTSTLSAPTHTYAITGTFTVSLTVGGPGGSDTKTRAAYVNVYEQECNLPSTYRWFCGEPRAITKHNGRDSHAAHIYHARFSATQCLPASVTGLVRLGLAATVLIHGLLGHQPLLASAGPAASHASCRSPRAWEEWRWSLLRELCSLA